MSPSPAPAPAPAPASTTTLTIGHTWDGLPLPTPAATLTLSVEGGALVLRVEAPLHGDPPPAAPPGPTPALWEHEVVELFVMGEGPAYTEIELGPYGHHLVLRLSDVRQVRDQLHPIAFHVEREAARWRGVARVPLALLPPRPWRGNAYAIFGQGARRTYTAWRPVPGPQPDFHQPERFSDLRLG